MSQVRFVYCTKEEYLKNIEEEKQNSETEEESSETIEEHNN